MLGIFGRSMRRAALIAASVLCMSLMTGCWDRVEIEDRAIVLGVSIDKAPAETASLEDDVSHKSDSKMPPNTDMIRMAAQIALPGRIPLGPGESGGSGSGDPQQTVWVIDVVGHSVEDAFTNLQQQLSSRLFLGHLRVIVVSEEMARLGLDNVNDYFHRDSEVRRMAWLMVSKGPAIELLKAGPKLERIPALYLMTTLDESIRMGKFPQDYIGIYWARKAKLGQEGFLPYVEMKKEQNIEIKGLALFRNARMVGETDPLDIGSFMALRGVNPGGYTTYVQAAGNFFMVNVTHRESKVKVSIRDGRPYFSFDLGLEFNLREKLNDSASLENMNVITEIESTLKKNAEQLTLDMLKKTQALGSDILGLGEYVRAHEPRYWNTHVKTKERWQLAYKDIGYEIHIDTRIRRIGMKAK